MKDVVQIDLFATEEPEPILNGMYYEGNTDMFVSYVMGRRHYQVSAKGCKLDKAWHGRSALKRSVQYEYLC